MQRGGVGAEECIELFVGAFEISGEAQEFCEQTAGGDVGRVIADAFKAGGNSTLEIAALNEFVKVRHGRSCCGMERKKVRSKAEVDASGNEGDGAGELIELVVGLEEQF
jgi:hypothetical protein